MDEAPVAAEISIYFNCTAATILPTCSSVRGTSSSRARSLPHLPRRWEEREWLERPAISNNMNGIQVCHRWRNAVRLTCTETRLFVCFCCFFSNTEPLISFCRRTLIKWPKLLEKLETKSLQIVIAKCVYIHSILVRYICVSARSGFSENIHMHFVQTVHVCHQGWLAPAKQPMELFANFLSDQ